MSNKTKNMKLLKQIAFNSFIVGSGLEPLVEHIEDFKLIARIKSDDTYNIFLNDKTDEIFEVSDGLYDECMTYNFSEITFRKISDDTFIANTLTDNGNKIVAYKLKQLGIKKYKFFEDTDIDYPYDSLDNDYYCFIKFRNIEDIAAFQLYFSKNIK